MYALVCCKFYYAPSQNNSILTIDLGTFDQSKDNLYSKCKENFQESVQVLSILGHY